MKPPKVNSNQKGAKFKVKDREKDKRGKIPGAGTGFFSAFGKRREHRKENQR